MFKLMLVDDEPVIRKGIRTSIEWDKYDVEIAGEASNGRDALEMALALEPDIVVTDIRMPVMDGLGLAAELRARLPDTRTVILSGYDDFAYAKKAISLGVSEYLLKPVRAEDLVSLVVKLKTGIAKARLEKNMNRSAEITFHENLLNLRAYFVNRLLKGEYTDPDYIDDRAAALKLDLSGPEYLAFVIEIDDFHSLAEKMPERDVELLKFSVVNISEELFSSHARAAICYGEAGRLLGLACFRKPGEIQLERICKDIQHYVRKYLDLSVSIGLGSTRKDILGAPEACSEALAALESKIYKGRKSIIFYSPAADGGKKAGELRYPFGEEKEMMGYLKTLNPEGINPVLERIFTSFAESRAGAENVKNICSRLVVTAIGCVAELGVDVQGSLGASFNPYREVDRFDVLEDLKKWLQAFFERLLTLVQDNKTDKFKGIVKTALKYIEENYPKDISLADISNIVYVTPNYLSRVFKEELGVNFVEWLNRFRVEKAKALLSENGAKTYEVAVKVGYKDYKYFSGIFKKYAGCTPKEFKEK